MPLLDMEYLDKVEKYLDSGDLAFDFEHADEDKKYEILDFLEKLMDVAEKADEVATKSIFGKLMGMMGQDDQ